jgi:ferredoxin
MPKVVYDYGKCRGVGTCADVCPLDILEVSENKRWCKPVDEKVENREAVEEFHEKVESEEHGAVNVVIENEMPECISCRACELQCPHEAIRIVE